MENGAKGVMAHAPMAPRKVRRFRSLLSTELFDDSVTSASTFFVIDLGCELHGSITLNPYHYYNLAP